jgi:hypothetical protein
MSRWEKIIDGNESPSDCGGHYNTWIARPSKWTADRIEALEALSGVTLSAASRNAMASHGVLMPIDPSSWQYGYSLQKSFPDAVAPPKLAQFLTHVETLFGELHGTRTKDYIDTMPNLGDGIGVSGGVVKPTPWMLQFIDTFLPKVATPKRVVGKPGAQVLAPRPTFEEASATFPKPFFTGEPTERSLATNVAIAAGSVATGALLFWLVAS